MSRTCTIYRVRYEDNISSSWIKMEDIPADVVFALHERTGKPFQKISLDTCHIAKRKHLSRIASASTVKMLMWTVVDIYDADIALNTVNIRQAIVDFAKRKWRSRLASIYLPLTSRSAPIDVTKRIVDIADHHLRRTSTPPDGCRCFPSPISTTLRRSRHDCADRRRWPSPSKRNTVDP